MTDTLLWQENKTFRQDFKLYAHGSIKSIKSINQLNYLSSGKCQTLILKPRMQHAVSPLQFLYLWSLIVMEQTNKKLEEFFEPFKPYIIL